MESSAPDLARFGLAAMTGKLLGKQLTDFMFQKQTVDGLATERGLAWSFGPHGQPEHGGAQQGCRTLMVLDREHGTVYVVMTNTGGNHPIGQLMAAVMTAWGERKIQSP
jgi:CubicO group peptidase (beta-lactamase class C family)